MNERGLSVYYEKCMKFVTLYNKMCNINFFLNNQFNTSLLFKKNIHTCQRGLSGIVIFEI